MEDAPPCAVSAAALNNGPTGTFHEAPFNGRGKQQEKPQTAPYAQDGMHKKEGAMLQQHNPLKYLVRLAGFEPATHCLEGSCSIQLSYKRAPCVVVKLGRGVKQKFHVIA